MRGTRHDPKLIIFLIDESTSMTGLCAGVPKHTVVDRCVNSSIEQLVTVCNRADGVRDYAELAVVGYGGNDKEAPVLRSLLATSSGSWTASLSAVAAMAAVEDGRARYFTSTPEGWTPMGAAIRLGGRLVSDWLETHPNSPAPVIVTISDGVPTDDEVPEGPVDAWAAKLPMLATEDGPCLLINVGAPQADALARCVFPTDLELPQVEGTQRLWQMASPLPDELVPRAMRLGLLPQDTKSAEGRRLYAHGTDETVLEKIFDFGTEVRPH
jgi:hypothetical protein